MKKIIFIGAGPGGLSAAMLLAHKGYQVDIYEKKDRVGGRNSSINLGEFCFDMGPTFFLMKDVLEDIFNGTGRKLSDYISLKRLEPMYRLVFQDGEFFPYSSLEKENMEAEFERAFPGEYKNYLRYLKREDKKYEKLIPCLKVPYSNIWCFFKKRFLNAFPYLDAHTSIYKVLGKYYNNENLKLAFTFQSKYIGMSPWEAPGTFSIIPYIEHGHGIFHVEGGLNQLSSSMAQAVEEMGGKIHLNRSVSEIIVENKTAKGVILENGEKQYADAVVVNADFGTAMTELIPERYRKKYSDEKVKNKKYSCSTFMLYLGVDKIYSEFPHHNIIFADDYRKNVDDITKEKILSDDFSFYIQNASVTDSTLAPVDMSTIYVLVPVPNNKSSVDWDVEKDKFRDKVIKCLEKKGDFRDLSKHIVEEKIITPKDWSEDMGVYLGATFNLGHQVSQMLFFRPHNKFEELKNCYLVGGGTHPGSGLPTIYESGKISADLIHKKFERGR